MQLDVFPSITQISVCVQIAVIRTVDKHNKLCARITGIVVRCTGQTGNLNGGERQLVFVRQFCPQIVECCAAGCQHNFTFGIQVCIILARCCIERGEVIDIGERHRNVAAAHKRQPRGFKVADMRREGGQHRIIFRTAADNAVIQIVFQRGIRCRKRAP